MGLELPHSGCYLRPDQPSLNLFKRDRPFNELLKSSFLSTHTHRDEDETDGRFFFHAPLRAWNVAKCETDERPRLVIDH